MSYVYTMVKADIHCNRQYQVTPFTTTSHMTCTSRVRINRFFRNHAMQRIDQPVQLEPVARDSLKAF